MSRRRRAQRSVRVSVATALLVLAAACVAAAVLSSVLVSAAALFAVFVGAVAAGIVYGEVLQTRLELACQSAARARSFREESARRHGEHQAFAIAMAGRLRERDRTIVELVASVRSANRRAGDAESRVSRETRRADEAQRRLASLLDEVFGTSDADGDDLRFLPLVRSDREVGRPDYPTVVNLLAWEEKAQSLQSGAEDPHSGAVA